MVETRAEGEGEMTQAEIEKELQTLRSELNDLTERAKSRQTEWRRLGLIAMARAFDPAKYRDNPKMIAKYLNDALATGDASLITKAIGDMVRAQGMSRFSQKVGLSREGLDRSFKGQAGPGFDTVITVLLALDIRLVAKPSAGL